MNLKNAADRKLTLYIIASLLCFIVSLILFLDTPFVLAAFIFEILNFKLDYIVYCASCTFTDHIEELNKDSNSLAKDNFLVICESIAQKMLSNANVSLVSVDMPVTTNLDDASGLCLRFGGEILSNSMPCLLTVTVEGKCSDPLSVSIKVNCEETVFGLNFLNRVVNFLAELSHTQS